MKKMMNWMFAAILLCGLSLVITSCGSDDDDDSIKDPQTTPNTYEVNITAVLPQIAAQIFSLEVEYTDAEGKTHTATVKAGDQTEPMATEAKVRFDNAKEFAIGFQNMNEEQKKVFDNLIVKNFKMTVPSGKSYSFKSTMKAVSPLPRFETETFDYLAPIVFSTAKIISGNTPSGSTFREKLGMSVKLSIESAEIEAFSQLYDGSSAGEGSQQMD